MNFFKVSLFLFIFFLMSFPFYMWILIGKKEKGKEKEGLQKQPSCSLKAVDDNLSVFSDIIYKIEPKVSFQWGNCYQAFKERDYSGLLDKEEEKHRVIYNNIEKLGLHKATSRPRLIPFSKSITWLVYKTNLNNRLD